MSTHAPSSPRLSPLRRPRHAARPSYDANSGEPKLRLSPTTPRTHYNLHSMRYWDVKMPPIKRHMVQGYLVPTVKSTVSKFLTKRRRITMEVYRSDPRDGPSPAVRAQMFHQLLRGISSSGVLEDETLDDDDIVVFRILKPNRSKKGEGTDEQGKDQDDDGDWGTLILFIWFWKQEHAFFCC